MRYMILTFLASILCLTASAQPKYSLLRPEVEAAVDGLWPILSKATGDNKHEQDEDATKEFIDRLVPLLADLHPLTPHQRLYLSVNRPIRDGKQYGQRVSDLPEDRWNDESKEMLRKWFEADARTEGEKEAMGLLLILIEPDRRAEPQRSTDTSGQQAVAPPSAEPPESDSEDGDKPQAESGDRSR